MLGFAHGHCAPCAMVSQKSNRSDPMGRTSDAVGPVGQARRLRPQPVAQLSSVQIFLYCCRSVRVCTV